MTTTHTVLIVSSDKEINNELFNIIKTIDQRKYLSKQLYSADELLNQGFAIDDSIVLIDIKIKDMRVKKLSERLVGTYGRHRFSTLLFSINDKKEDIEEAVKVLSTDIFRYPFIKSEIYLKLEIVVERNEYHKIIREHSRCQKQLDKVIAIGDRQQLELKNITERQKEIIEEATAEIRDLNKEIEETQREVIFTMGAIGESRSKETGNHVKRVAEYSHLLALKYGLSETESELLKQASPMHDIGKVAIPDSILNKPGRLTDEEFIIMQKHAELGYEMLKHSNRKLLKIASIVAYEHHEKWNGKGYPQGLKGNEISIYGRITAIADVFDALGSDRVYKKAWSDDKIFDLFNKERGEHFDPQLIDLFFENLTSILEIRASLKDNFSYYKN